MPKKRGNTLQIMGKQCNRKIRKGHEICRIGIEFLRVDAILYLIIRVFMTIYLLKDNRNREVRALSVKGVIVWEWVLI